MIPWHLQGQDKTLTPVHRNLPLLPSAARSRGEKKAGWYPLSL